MNLTARRLLSLIALVGALFGLVLPASSASAAGDDYLWKYATTNTADWFGFTKRQCVSFVAWELHQRGRPLNNYTQRWGSAYRWDDVARARSKTVTTRPKVGAVAQWNSYERSPYYTSSGVGYFKAGGYGHVAFVTYVYGDGSVKVEQYNLFGSRSFSTMRVKAPRYLYL